MTPLAAQQPLKNGETYWWRSEDTYEFEDDGTWVFHFYREITPPQASCNVRGEILVRHEETYYLVRRYEIKGLTGEFYERKDIMVTFDQTIEDSCKENGCYIIFTMSISCDQPNAMLHLHTGFQERYTRLEIPENLLLLLIPILSILSKRLNLKSQSRSV